MFNFNKNPFEAGDLKKKALTVLTSFLLAAPTQAQENHDYKKGYDQNKKFTHEIFQTPEAVSKHAEMIKNHSPYAELNYKGISEYREIDATSEPKEGEIVPEIIKVREYNDAFPGNKNKGVEISVDYRIVGKDGKDEMYSLQVNDTNRDGQGDFFIVLGMVNNKWGPDARLGIKNDKTHHDGGDSIPDRDGLSRPEIGKAGQAVLDKVDAQYEKAMKMVHDFSVGPSK